MNWKDNFKEGKELVLATSSKNGKPNANIVISLGFIDDKLMIVDCQMNQTLKNLKENPRICVIGKYVRVLGEVDIYNSGKFFDLGVKVVKKQDDSLKVKNIISISIEEVFDLSEGKKINSDDK